MSPPELEAAEVELTLRYRGDDLAASGSDKRVREKHSIRKILHEQLASYWRENPRLRELNEKVKSLQIAKVAGAHFNVDRPIVGQDKFYWRYPLGGYDFVPLVSYVQELHCRLDIRIYRKSKEGGILFDGGDLDNRLKTFFDALQVPRHSEQLPAPAEPEILENPQNWPALFCLLDDDRAITGLSIQSLKLLTAIPENCAHPENYAELDVDVTITPATPIMGSLHALFP
jgi:hypothetical protein